MRLFCQLPLPLITLIAPLTALCNAAYNPIFDQSDQHLLSSLHLSANMTRAPVIVLSHGGGPLPILGDPGHKHICNSLKTRVPKILRLDTPQAPRAIVLVTAHWSERNPTISSGSKHRLLYDYHGFPAESYRLKYDAPGSPEVAEEVAQAMREVGLKPELDDDRGQ